MYSRFQSLFILSARATIVTVAEAEKGCRRYFVPRPGQRSVLSTARRHSRRRFRAGSAKLLHSQDNRTTRVLLGHDLSFLFIAPMALSISELSGLGDYL